MRQTSDESRPVESEAFLQEHALELLRARAMDICDDLSVSGIVLKGRAPELHGFLPKRVPADVDLLIPPPAWDPFVNALEGLGWRERPWEDPDRLFPQHSVTFYHPSWPVDLDLHYRFPGLEANSDAVVELLCVGSSFVCEGGRSVRVTGRVETAVVAVVHAKRRVHDQRSVGELAELERKVPEIVTANEFYSCAQGLGALAAVRSFACAVYPQLREAKWPEPTEDWLTYSGHRNAASIRLAAIFDAPVSAMPSLIRHAIWPSREALAARDLKILEAGPMELLKARLERAQQAVRAIPETWEDFLRGRARRK